MEPVRRARLQASALLLVMFVVGGLAGAAANRVLLARQAETGQTSQKANDSRGESRGRNGGIRGRSILLDPQVLEQLHVTPEQRAKISEILGRRDAQTRQLFVQADSVMKQTRRELQAQLTEDQRNKLGEIIKEHHRRREEQRRNRTPDGKPDSVKKQTEK